MRGEHIELCALLIFYMARFYMIYCEVLMEANTLIINNATHVLSCNEMLILKTLYESNEQPVSQSAIMETCWPGRVVSPASLPVAIKHIRDVFRTYTDDDIIITHKGKGYSINKSRLEMSFSKNALSAVSNKPSNLVTASCVLRTTAYLLACIILPYAILKAKTHIITTNKDGVTYVSDFAIPGRFDKGAIGDTIYISHLDVAIYCGKNKSECYYENDIY